MLNQKPLLLALLVSIIGANQFAFAGELEAPVDVRYVSQLRVELRSLHQPERCESFWAKISDKLENNSSNSLDVVVLTRLSQYLKTRQSYKLLADFVDSCVDALSSKYKQPAECQAKQDEAADLNDDVGLLLQDLDELKTQLAEREQELASERARNGEIDQLTRERDEAMRRADKLKLELEATTSRSPIQQVSSKWEPSQASQRQNAVKSDETTVGADKGKQATYAQSLLPATVAGGGHLAPQPSPAVNAFQWMPAAYSLTPAHYWQQQAYDAKNQQQKQPKVKSGLGPFATYAKPPADFKPIIYDKPSAPILPSHAKQPMAVEPTSSKKPPPSQGRWNLWHNTDLELDFSN